MSRLQWSKFFWSAHTKRWRGHPFQITGAWTFMLEALQYSDDTGTLTRPLSAWASIIGSSEEFAKEVIDYLEKFRMAEVGRSKDGISITSRRLARDNKAIVGKLESAAKDANSGTKSRRKAFLFEIYSAYPGGRATCQVPTQKKAIGEIMIDASRAFKSNERYAAEKAVTETIISYIEEMKASAAWAKDDGDKIPGLGNFLVSRGWEHPNRNTKKAPLRIVGEEDENAAEIRRIYGGSKR